MRFPAPLLFALPLCLSFTTTNGKTVQKRAEDYGGYADVCKEISQSISSAGAVYYPGNTQYAPDITAWSPTNEVNASCVVEPGNSKDVASTLKILGSMKAKFAVKSGGHSPNPGFSSTAGVLVAMHRVWGVKYDSASQTAVIGTGMIWDDVYQALEPYSVSVVGAWASGVSVGGFLLGGGTSYSPKTNQHGLAIDTITAFELVQPNGKIITVTEQSYPDLFFGLKGGFNNFGIVTQFTMRTFPQTAVWGGVIGYDATQFKSVKAAFTDFTSKDRDPKASILTAFTSTPSSVSIGQILFYDGPSPPKGLFDMFLNIPSVASDISERSLLSMVRSLPANATRGLRNSYGTVAISNYTNPVVDAVYNEATFWRGELEKGNASLAAVSYLLEAYSSSILSHNTQPTAYPPDRSHVFSLLNINYVWTSAVDDHDFFAATSQSQTVFQTLVQPSQPLTRNASLFPNHALPDTPLERMYGTNVAKLRALRKEVDPDDVMGLAGGFKF